MGEPAYDPRRAGSRPTRSCLPRLVSGNSRYSDYCRSQGSG
ncbi:hypothetical protein ACFPM0_31085 [Pseudonocardia sulfidoxydans]